jgi:TonB family protein
MRISNPATFLVALATTAFIAPDLVLAGDAIQLPTATAMARVKTKATPSYPPAAKQLGISGVQEATIVVNDQGDVEEVTVSKGNAIFTNASVTALKRWKFTPYLKDGQPVKFTTIVSLNYTTR